MEDWPYEKDRRFPQDRPDQKQDGEHKHESPFYQGVFPLESPFYEYEMDPDFHPEPPRQPEIRGGPRMEREEDDWEWPDPHNPPFEDGSWPWPGPYRKRDPRDPKGPKSQNS